MTVLDGLAFTVCRADKGAISANYVGTDLLSANNNVVTDRNFNFRVVKYSISMAATGKYNCVDRSMIKIRGKRSVTLPAKFV